VQDARNAEVFAGSEGAYADMVSRILIFLPPGGPHERTRSLIYRAFTPNAVERRRPRVEAVIGDLIAKVAGRGEFDLLHEVLYELPMTVICELLGASGEERAKFMESFSQQGHEVADVGSASEEQHRHADRNVELFTANVKEMIERHRSAPGDDILTTLIQASDDGDRLSQDEVIAAIYILIGAGHETTANLLGNGLAHLLRDRPQWQRLVEHPDLVPSTIEELLRYDTSVQFNQRVANEDVVYEGIPIAENDRIIVLLGAANRDPEVFDSPDTLDITRDPNPHLAFGAGLYHCLGIHLARMQMQIALDAIVRHLPGLRLAGEPAWRPTWMMRGLVRMPVES
jgi:cytochrome P450